MVEGNVRRDHTYDDLPMFPQHNPPSYAISVYIDKLCFPVRSKLPFQIMQHALEINY